MKNLKLIKVFIFLIIFFGIRWSDNSLANNSTCPELPYLKTEYAKLHRNDIETKCRNGTYTYDDKCYELAQVALDNFENCFGDCANVDIVFSKCGNPYDSSVPDCYWYECSNKIDNDCAEKCKHYLLFEYNTVNKDKEDNDDNANRGEGNNTSNNEEDLNYIIGSPVNSGGSGSSPCIGKTIKNSELCPSDNIEVFYYAEKELVKSCSVPEGSSPKCEYVCKNGYDFIDGECESVGFFARIMNWLGSLFK